MLYLKHEESMLLPERLKDQAKISSEGGVLNSASV